MPLDQRVLNSTVLLNQLDFVAESCGIVLRVGQSSLPSLTLAVVSPAPSCGSLRFWGQYSAVRNDVLAGLTLIAGVMAVSTGAILVKLCDLNPLSVGAYRLTLALPLFWLAAERVDPGWRGRIRKDQMGFLALSGVMLGLHFATWVASLSFTSVTSSVVLVTTNPIFVGIGSVLLLKEKVSARLWAGTFIAFAGTVVVAFGSSLPATAAPNPPLGNALALFGAVCMSGYLLVGRRLSGELPTVCYVTSVYTVAALTLWLGVLLTSAPTHGFSGKQWILLAMMALIPQGIGHTLLNRSLRVLPASMVAVAILGEPVFATLAAIPILNEYPTLTHVGGGLLVILGVGLAVSAGKRRPPE